MSKFCADCGYKFKTTDKFCPKCGNQKVTEKDLSLLSNVTRPAFRVLFLQILLFFIFPIVYLRNLQTSLKTRSKFVNFSYNLWYLSLLSMLFSIYVRYLWVLFDASPSESDIFFGFSTMLFLAPYVLWWLSYWLTYLLSVIFSVTQLNELLPVKHKVNALLALLFGVFYIQVKINSAVGTNKKVYRATKRNRLGYNRVIFTGIVGLVVLALTPAGKIAWSHVNAQSSFLSSEMYRASMDIQGKTALADSSPSLTSMDDVAKLCENNADIVLSLGCNIQTDDKFKIYISQVNEPSLKGIEVYSLAHEMLHTVYAKLEPKEKAEIERALLELYPKIMASNDVITINAIKPYLSENQDILVNELHSIVPIYSGDIGSVLDHHYSKYFKKRTQLAGAYKNAEQVLLDAEKKVSDFEASIDSFEAYLNNVAEVIARQEADLNYYARSGNVYSYNNTLGPYNYNIDLYNSNYDKYKVEFVNYNKVYDYYTSLYTSLRRNITYQEAALITGNSYTKIR